MAGRPGFEPGLTESESVVLPLDDLPLKLSDYLYIKAYKESIKNHRSDWPVMNSTARFSRAWVRFLPNA